MVRSSILSLERFHQTKAVKRRRSIPVIPDFVPRRRLMATQTVICEA